MYISFPCFISLQNPYQQLILCYILIYCQSSFQKGIQIAGTLMCSLPYSQQLGLCLLEVRRRVKFKRDSGNFRRVASKEQLKSQTVTFGISWPLTSFCSERSCQERLAVLEVYRATHITAQLDKCPKALLTKNITLHFSLSFPRCLKFQRVVPRNHNHFDCVKAQGHLGGPTNNWGFVELVIKSGPTASCRKVWSLVPPGTGRSGISESSLAQGGRREHW